MLYDNDRCLVARILPDGVRKRARLFSGFLSHYVIRDRYGRLAKATTREVEGLVGWVRNFMVPLRVCVLGRFNAWLEQCHKAAASAATRDDRTAASARSAAMADLPLPLEPATGDRPGEFTVAGPLQTNDYSVPVAYGHRDVWVGLCRSGRDRLRWGDHRPPSPVL